MEEKEVKLNHFPTYSVAATQRIRNWFEAFSIRSSPVIICSSFICTTKLSNWKPSVTVHARIHCLSIARDSISLQFCTTKEPTQPWKLYHNLFQNFMRTACACIETIYVMHARLCKKRSAFPLHSSWQRYPNQAMQLISRTGGRLKC